MSIIRSWKNGAILSVDNLELSRVSGSLVFVRLIRVTLNFSKRKTSFYDVRFWEQCVDYLNSKKSQIGLFVDSSEIRVGNLNPARLSVSLISSRR